VFTLKCALKFEYEVFEVDNFLCLGLHSEHLNSNFYPRSFYGVKKKCCNCANFKLRSLSGSVYTHF